MKRRSFTERYPPDHMGEVYGPLFREVRRKECVLATMAYCSVGHYGCWRGTQGGHTAHHVGLRDEDGLLPVCGRAHDLFAGYGGERTIKAFRAWLEAATDMEWREAIQHLAGVYVSEARQAPLSDMEW